jgi:SAM-dependent methyltransferase
MKMYDHAYAATYAALWAYGSDTLSLSGTEQVYQLVTRLAREAVGEGQGKKPLTFVDLGCGVGRTVRDLAMAFPNAAILGLDRSSAMVERARSMLNGGAPEVVDLSSRGFGCVKLQPVNLPNARLDVFESEHDATVVRLRGSCDVVVSLNTIERANDPDAYAACAISLLKAGGALVLASSLNWQSTTAWARFPSFPILRDHVARMGGMQVEAESEDIPYFETIDARGAGESFTVSAAVLRKILTSEDSQ